MPYVNVKVAGPLSEEQRREISKQVSETLETVAGKPKDHTYVVIDEVPRNQWGVGDKLLSD